jgi:hypothetical protein
MQVETVRVMKLPSRIFQFVLSVAAIAALILICKAAAFAMGWLAYHWMHPGL